MITEPRRWAASCDALRRWYAVSTRCHHQAKTVKILAHETFDVFYPTRKVTSTTGPRRRIIEVPLLLNYLLIHTSPDRFSEIVTVPGVAYILGYNGRPTPVPDEEVHSLKLMVHSGREVLPHSYLQKGDRVLIKDGPLKGTVGVLLKIDPSSWRLVVSVHLMNRSVAVKLSASDVEKYL